MHEHAAALRAWEAFYVIVGTSAGALTGLPLRALLLRSAALVALLAAASATPLRAATVLDCDRPSSPHEAFQLEGPPAPACIPGGPTGGFLRLADTAAVNLNSIAFDLTDPGAWDLVVADFDFRLTPKGAESRADGFGFTLASTAEWGTSGYIPSRSEEPDVARSLGIGFDIHQGPGEVSRNHVSLHWDGTRIAEVDATPLLELASGRFTHARITVRAGTSPPDVTVTLTPCGAAPVTLIDRLPVPGLAPYESRVHLMARSGGEEALHDLDNLNVQFLRLDQGTVSFAAATVEAIEVRGGEALVTVTRSGDLGGATRVDYATAGGSAHADEDFASLSGTIAFASGEEAKTIRVPLLDDAATEGEERFVLRLTDPTGNTTLGGPNEVTIVIVDDETARTTGHWSDVLCWPVIAVHATALPDGRVMVWPGDEGHGGRSGDDPHAWEPATGAIRPLARAGFDIFCSGHTLTADGRVFVAGGHVMEAVGLARASVYDPVADRWTSLPDMNAGRWYPTTTTLANGELLVVAGSIDESMDNELPQVQPANGGAWRDLHGAMLAEPELARYYPWMYVAPDGRVFCAGRQRDTWYLDTRGHGSWTYVARRSFGKRDYGSSVMYEPGKVLVAGGNPRNEDTPDADLPTASVEVIDLTAPSPAWRDVAPMALARRQLNTTLLPDGTVLATGGTSARGFNNVTEAALHAEAWDPASEQWTTLAPMAVPRLYHSTALLLQDGRVLVAGGGLPPAVGGDVNHADAQVFSPPYLFRGPRPVVTSAPTEVSYGEAFLVETPHAADIATVRWIRLSSVTHSFNENQRSNVLPFSATRAGLFATAPRDSNLCPPGHYILFVLTADGVPSAGRVVRVTRPPGGHGVPGDHGLVLRGARPNPARHGLFVEFALTSREPAELSVHDLTGRLVLRRELVGLGIGAHVHDLGAGSGLAPGVYLIRLRQGDRTASAKAVVLEP
jgi:hypothetical protein